MVDLGEYQAVFFDCDGVLLDSNPLKTEAFYQAALPQGRAHADRLVQYHKENGGVSRVPKFQYYLEKILGDFEPKPTLVELTDRYERFVSESLFSCELAQSIFALRQEFPSSDWAVLSGGKQEEVRAVLDFKGCAPCFNAGIFGSPKTKESILHDSFSDFRKPALLVGDSEYDYQVAKQFRMDFIFVYGWTGMLDWKVFCDRNDIPFIEGLESLVDRKITV